MRTKKKDKDLMMDDREEKARKGSTVQVRQFTSMEMTDPIYCMDRRRTCDSISRALTIACGPPPLLAGG
jgi:hypothetical protein